MKVAALGECMLELSSSDHNLMKLGFGGDTLNTAVYLSRLGGKVDYLTALGDDPFSDEMIAAWRHEGVGTALVQRIPKALPGMYMIKTDEQGERRFYYWRDSAPSQRMFDDATIFNTLRTYPFLYLSGITLSLYKDDVRARLFHFLQDYRSKGGKVIFDINYRPMRWAQPDAARQAISTMLALTDIGLPSLDDEKLLFGDVDHNACIERYAKAGVTEVIVKDGVNGCWLLAEGEQSHLPVPQTVQPIDTTAAGDSFNGGFMSKRIKGLPLNEAVLMGQRCAAFVIQHKGAITSREAFDRAFFD